MRQIFTQKPLLGSPINFSHPLAKGLIGLWLFNEGSGDLVRDLSENGNNGILENMAFPSTSTSGWNSGKNGIYLKFDSSNDYVNCGNDVSLDTINAITIIARITPTVVPFTNWRMIVSKNFTAYELYGISGSNEIRSTITIGGITRNMDTINSGLVSGGCYQVVTTFDGKNWIIYIDTIVKANTSAWVGSIGTNADVLRIGSRVGAGLLFDGAIDEVCIYNRALSAEEIQELYINPYGIFERQKFGLSQPPGMDYLYESSVNLITNFNNMSTYFKILSTSLSINFINVFEYFKNLGINLSNNIDNIKDMIMYLSENLSINFINPLKYFKNLDTNLSINFNNILKHFKNLGINLVNNINNIKYTTIHLSENIQYNITLFTTKLIQYTFNIITTLIGVKVPMLSKDLNIKFDYTVDTPYNYFKLLLNLLISLNLSDKKKFTLPISFDVISNLIKSVPHSKDIAFTLNLNLSDVKNYTKSVTQYLSLGHVRILLTDKQIDQLMNLNLIIGKKPIKVLNDTFKIATNVMSMGVVNLSLELLIVMNKIQSYIKRENVNIQFNIDESLLYTLIKQLNLTLVESINSLLTHILDLNAQISMNISNIKVISKSIQSNINITLSRNFTFAIGRVKVKIKPIIVKVNSGFTNIRSKLNAGRK